MGSRDRVAQLEELVEAHKALIVLEDAAAQAKNDYRAALGGGDEPAIAEAKAAHRAASQALNDAREAAASGDVMVAEAIPGSATVRPDTVRAGV